MSETGADLKFKLKLLKLKSFYNFISNGCADFIKPQTLLNGNMNVKMTRPNFMAIHSTFAAMFHSNTTDVNLDELSNEKSWGLFSGDREWLNFMAELFLAHWFELIRFSIRTIKCLEMVSVNASNSWRLHICYRNMLSLAHMQTVAAQCTPVRPYSHYSLNHITSAFPICAYVNMIYGHETAVPS